MNTDPRLQAAIDILTDKTAGETTRIAACHDLGQLSGKEPIDALVVALSDADVGVRWAAADALRHHAPAAIEAVLSELATKPADSRLYESAHHMLSGTSDPIVKPVLKALDDPVSSDSETPFAAYKAVGEWRKQQK